MRKGSVCYVITLSGVSVDLPVAIFDTRSGVDAFLTANRPAPVEGRGAVREGPLARAMDVAGFGPSIVFGYKVWEFTDHALSRVWNRRWVDGEWPVPANKGATAETEANEENEPWEKPAFPQEEWDGVHNTGGGPVG